MLSDLLDVLREHGWSETGPDHDAARWLKSHFDWLDERVSEAEQETDRANVERRAAERKTESAEDARDESRRQLKELRQQIARGETVPA